ncbi:hypothetical protein B0T25DRAFT_421549, partial [Lasiosphaeria hispida]
NRPKNTKKAYDRKAKEFVDWCEDRGFPDGFTVTEDELLLFLNQEVIGWPLRKKSRQADPEAELNDGKLSWRSVQLYITAATDLWRQQKGLGMNTHSSPRGDSIQAFIKALRRE